MGRKLIKLRGETHDFTILFRGFNTPLSATEEEQFTFKFKAIWKKFKIIFCKNNTQPLTGKDIICFGYSQMKYNFYNFLFFENNFELREKLQEHFKEPYAFYSDSPVVKFCSISYITFSLCLFLSFCPCLFLSVYRYLTFLIHLKLYHHIILPPYTSVCASKKQSHSLT